jgi:hypothetical protein
VLSIELLAHLIASGRPEDVPSSAELAAEGGE